VLEMKEKTKPHLPPIKNPVDPIAHAWESLHKKPLPEELKKA